MLVLSCRVCQIIYFKERFKMRVAYIFSTNNAQRILDKMIIPQMLEERRC